MKKLFIFLAIFVLACKPKGADQEKAATMTAAPDNLVTYAYKVGGIQDSLIADTIWRMIFTYEGIDKLVISNKDSTIVFTVDPEKVKSETIKQEIEKRGGKIIQ